MLGDCTSSPATANSPKDGRQLLAFHLLRPQERGRAETTGEGVLWDILPPEGALQAGRWVEW